MMSGDDGLLELSDAIELIRQQLVGAQLRGRQVVAGQVLTFAVGKVAVEFTGELKRVTGRAGGLKFAVLTADAKREDSVGSTHKVQVELIPMAANGASFMVADGMDAVPEH